MSWRPNSEMFAVRDPRLDFLRGRVAQLHDGEGRLFATVIFEPFGECSQAGGHLWWRRWSDPRESVMVMMHLADGSYTDWVCADEILPDELAAWSKGAFPWQDRTYQLRWLDDDAARTHRSNLLPRPPRRS